MGKETHNLQIKTIDISLNIVQVFCTKVILHPFVDPFIFLKNEAEETRKLLLTTSAMFCSPGVILFAKALSSIAKESRKSMIKNLQNNYNYLSLN